MPVDFEEVEITKNSSEEEFANALTCIKRNGVALKGECLWKITSSIGLCYPKEMRMYVHFYNFI